MKKAISIRKNLNSGNFADSKDRHFLITSQKDLDYAQKSLRRKEGFDEIKEKIIEIAGRKGLIIDDSKWKTSSKDDPA